MPDSGPTPQIVDQNPAAIPVQQKVLVLLLLLFYCIPDFLIFFAGLWAIHGSPSGKIDADASISSLMSELGTHSGLYTNTIHQMILPAIAGITAVSAHRINIKGWDAWIFIIPLASIFVCIFNSLLFKGIIPLTQVR